MRAKISLYPARGEFQLIVDYFERAGEGALRIAFEKLKLQLSAEGLFDAAHKKALPKFPKTIGIITSETGAALHDICSILKQRFSMIAIIIYPCLMQGKLAARQIAQQIQCANKRKECELLILARGGGSLEDLWPFNEEGVARAIFNSHLPIISAIGHETDFTIADFVADHRAATPSMAAQLASPDKLEYLRLLNKTTQRLTQAIRYQLVHYHHLLKNLATRLRDPRQYLQDTIQRLDNLIQRLNLALKTQLHIRQEKLVGFSRTLHAISPLASLERGYALITLENTEQIVSHTHQVKVGDTIIATLSKGKLACRVERN